jgi:hypothetical protein
MHPLPHPNDAASAQLIGRTLIAPDGSAFLVTDTRRDEHTHELVIQLTGYDSDGKSARTAPSASSRPSPPTSRDGG